MVLEAVMGSIELAETSARGHLIGISIRLTTLLSIAPCLGCRPGREAPPSHDLHSHYYQKVRTDLTALDDCLLLYAEKHGGAFPDALEELVHVDGSLQDYHLVGGLPKDSWGRPYHYTPPDQARFRPNLVTYGRDGVPGGDGDDRDIDSTMVRAMGRSSR